MSGEETTGVEAIVPLAPRVRHRSFPPWLVITLLAIASLAVLGARAVARSAFTTCDEPTHLSAARSLRFHQESISNLEHPVLMKLLAALPITRVPPDRQIDDIRAARTPFCVVFGLLVLCGGLFAAFEAGPWAGVFVASILAIDPTLRSHGALIENDVLVSLFILASAFLVDLATRAPLGGLGFLFGAGLVYGLALVSKFSAAPFLIPFVAVAALAFWARGGPGRSRTLIARHLMLLFVAPALLVLYLVQGAGYSGVPRSKLRASTIAQFRQLQNPGAPERLVDSLPNAVSTYALGLKWVKSRAVPGKWCNYFLGRVSGRGSLAYFPVALGVKLTTATAAALALVLLGAPALLLAARPTRRHRLLRAVLRRAFIPGALGLLFLFLAGLSNVNIGLRHAFPCLPLLLVAAAGTARTFLRLAPRLLTLATTAVVVLSLAEAASFAGREISFGNWAVGGPAGLRRVLSDSNVDWGQEQGLMFARVRQGDLGRVGALTLVLDVEEAKRTGVKWFSTPGAAADLDSVFVSIFFFDLAHGLEQNREPYPRLMYTRSWLTPLVLGLEKRAERVEPFHDAYLLLHLRKERPGVNSSSVK